MDLKALSNYLEKHATSTVKPRGIKLFKDKAFYIVSSSETEVIALVKSSDGNDNYKVIVYYSLQSSTIRTSCTCPFDGPGICKHKIAICLHLLGNYTYVKPELSQSTKSTIKNTKTGIVYKQSKVVIDYEPLTKGFILDNASQSILNKAIEIANDYFMRRLFEYKKKEKNIIICDVGNYYDKREVTLQKVGNKFISSCDCNEKKFPLCEHKIAAILTATENFNYPDILTTLPSKEDAFQKIAIQYGFDKNETNLETYFDTFFDKTIGEIIAIPKVSGLKPITKKDNFLKNLNTNINHTLPILTNANSEENLTYAFFISLDDNTFDPFYYDILLGKIQYPKYTFECYSSAKGYAARNKSGSGIMTENQSFIASVFSNLNHLDVEKIYDIPNHYNGEVVELNHIINELYQLKPLLSNEIIIVSDRATYNKTSAKQVIVPTNDYVIEFILDYKEPFYSLKPIFNFSGNSKFELHNYFILSENNLYPYKSLTDYQIIHEFIETPEILVHESGKNEFIENYVLPLSKLYPIIMKTNKIDIVQENATEYKPVIYLGESGNFLLIQPFVQYKEKEVELLLNEKIIVQNNNKHIEYRRDTEAEKATIDFLISLHPSFPKQVHRGYFYVKFDEILQKDWYFLFFDALKLAGIEVFGLEKIKAKKFYPYKPTISHKISSGIDWFEVNMQVNFGNENVSLKDIQKAILRKDNFVKLGDGSLGILPEEWLQKYTDLFKTAEIDKKGEIKISKLHFSLVDEMFDLIDQEDIAREIYEKKKRLVSFEEIEKPSLPVKINATLRPYQEAGYHWLSFLDSYKWGGCLADDMGLGKTLQMITFLKSRIDAAPKETNLVVVPTSLLFNWERELNKFAPDIKYLINSGSTREKDPKELKKHQLIITTYGLIINDIENIQKFKFNYVVLDESQAIKNPASQRYKAVCLLKSNNRMVMTGTPVENNTFDLYAQMSFVNPGLLGNINHFKDTFSDPIDKNGDQEAAQTLRKLINPFMLRRTKEQVATDLPDKTEDILICEMGEEQRRVYDKFRNEYRDSIGKSIDSQGLGKSSFMVLDALLKLRQICNSPYLLKTKENYTSESIKIQELVRHITQKTGNHKILIFSQFVEMLSLVKKEVEKLNIKYEYLDGSIASSKREEIVQNFQQNTDIRLFLISLKAGGVGLNLTEADYVYLIDPWWNPAVESQAIDRAHRIGQTKKVFAYKMICKDTIEEKVLQLQEKKKKVAADIISTEQSFYKQLEKDDIMDLFS